MEKTHHTFTELFKQLGLANDPQAIADFLKAHRPLHAGTRIEDAPFWTAAQRHLIQEQWAHDADWAEVMDQLSLALR